jgi:hypothetical protein
VLVIGYRLCQPRECPDRLPRAATTVVTIPPYPIVTVWILAVSIILIRVIVVGVIKKLVPGHGKTRARMAIDTCICSLRQTFSRLPSRKLIGPRNPFSREFEQERRTKVEISQAIDEQRIVLVVGAPHKPAKCATEPVTKCLPFHLTARFESNLPAQPRSWGVE